jgi:hypothetical protein
MQFLDVGASPPAEDNARKGARALATAYIDAGMRDPDRILSQTPSLLDFDQPIGLLFMDVLGHITDNGVRGVISCLPEALPRPALAPRSATGGAPRAVNAVGGVAGKAWRGDSR